MPATVITLSEYTHDDGAKRYSVNYNTMPVTPERTEERQAAEYARAVYHKARVPKRLTHWNGDTATLTLLDREGSRDAKDARETVRLIALFGGLP